MIRCAGLLAIIVLLGGFSSRPAEAATSVPQIAYVAATVPESLFVPETYLACIARTESVGSAVNSRLVCYSSEEAAPPLPPPPPPYDDWLPIQLSGYISGGYAYMPMFDCLEVFPGVAISGAVVFSLSGSFGNVNVSTDITQPTDCQDSVHSSGPLTLTPLSQDHDQDGDGCSDWEELGTDAFTGGSRDPFNPWDVFDINGDSEVDIEDTQAVAFRVDSPQVYDPDFDREVIGPAPWNLGPSADGVINMAEYWEVIAQYGTDCSGAP